MIYFSDGIKNTSVLQKKKDFGAVHFVLPDLERKFKNTDNLISKKYNP